MRISDWSSDVCSSDLKRGLTYGAGSLIDDRRDAAYLMAVTRTKTASANEVVGLILDQIGRFGREPVDAGRAGERATYLANSLSGQTESAAGRSEEHTSELQSLMRI